MEESWRYKKRYRKHLPEAEQECSAPAKAEKKRGKTA